MVGTTGRLALPGLAPGSYDNSYLKQLLPEASTAGSLPPSTYSVSVVGVVAGPGVDFPEKDEDGAAGLGQLVGDLLTHALPVKSHRS